MLLPLLLVAAVSAEVMTTQTLGVSLHRVQEVVHGPFLIGAAGPDALGRMERFVREDPSLKAKVVLVPLLGNPQAEMERALGKAGLSCGVRVEAHGETYTAESFGSCTPIVPPSISPSIPPGVPPSNPPSSSLTTLTTGTPQPAPSQTPLPGVLASSDRGSDETASQAATLYAGLPDPGTALFESIFVGYGAGHFYAGNTERGRIYLGIEGIATVVLVASEAAIAVSRNDKIPLFTADLGLIALAVGRLCDVYQAPISAHEAARRGYQVGSP